MWTPQESRRPPPGQSGRPAWYPNVDYTYVSPQPVEDPAKDGRYGALNLIEVAPEAVHDDQPIPDDDK